MSYVQHVLREMVGQESRDDGILCVFICQMSSYVSRTSLDVSFPVSVRALSCKPLRREGVRETLRESMTLMFLFDEQCRSNDLAAITVGIGSKFHIRP